MEFGYKGSVHSAWIYIYARDKYCLVSNNGKLIFILMENICCQAQQKVTRQWCLEIVELPLYEGKQFGRNYESKGEIKNNAGYDIFFF